MKSILTTILQGIGSFFALIWRGFVAVLKALFIDMPIGWIVIAVGGIFASMFLWVIPASRHEEWERCAAFCRTADCYANEHASVTTNICECYRLSDHAKIWINSKTGDRMIQDGRQRTTTKRR